MTAHWEPTYTEKDTPRMAHHSSTPQSVLSAPRLSPVVVSAQVGFSRSERRGGVYYPPKMTTEAKTAVYTEAVGAGRNQPATSTRERKIRKGRKARHNKAVAA